ncbi:MAG: mycothione reductase [Propionicimonas sp.]|uniref:mycothione reductase n=1 Tax=Propionicimonas sp. TaxID=1955623 RepID=UPI002B21BDD4|nr:mycothione reductase [Propionicimonas sp.]MEA4944930.1 mycothione reductase [Propionicimonas sp.]
MEHFDLCVIGSGSGNSLVNRWFRDQKVAIVDAAERFGGTCLNAGCIPTKMLAYPAELADLAREAGRLGVDTGEVSVRWGDIQRRIFDRVDAQAASALSYRERGEHVTLFREKAHFAGPRVLQVGDRQLSADAFVLAAGSRPRVPEIAGLDDPVVAERVHTSDTIMRIPHLPRRLVIVGGGSVATEFAHIFSGLGVEVTLLYHGNRLLRRADTAIGERFTELLSHRVTLHLGQELASLEAAPSGQLEVGTVDADGVEYSFEADLVLLAVGRVPNGDTLNLPAAGVDVHPDGRVVVDAYQHTTADGIWALGDICTPVFLKHVANHEMRVVQHNLLHPDDLVEADHRYVPQAVFSHPQVAWVGLTEQELQDAGREYVSATRDYSSVAYGWAMEDAGHFVKVLADPATGLLLGAHLIGPEASNLIQPLIQAMSFGLDAPTMARGQYWIHPALAEVVENALLDLRLGR